MRILGVDMATSTASVALIEDGFEDRRRVVSLRR